MTFIKAEYIKIYISKEGSSGLVTAFKGDDEIYHKKTGIGFNELAFLFEDEVIPLRNLLNALGYETTEEFLPEDEAR